MLERAGVERADLVVAVTGDDEDNLIVCQVATRQVQRRRRRSLASTIPVTSPTSTCSGISLTVSATVTILALIEHELPQHERYAA